MKALYEVTKPETVKHLLNSIDRTSLVLPDFQRTFVWSVEKTRALLASIVAGYPAGAMLAMKVDSPVGKVPFDIRSFEEAPKGERGRQELLVLDGQQRLTSLYHALFGKGEYRHFLRLRPYTKNPSSVDFNECLISLKLGSRKDKEFLEKYSSLAGQAEDLVLPLSVLMDNNSGGYVGWYRSICDLLPKREADKLMKSLAELQETLIEPILDYEFPWIVLKSHMSHEAIATVFDVVNNTGQRLSIFDLVVARTSERGKPTIRSKWSEACELVDDRPSLLGDYGIDPVYALYVVALLTTGAKSGKDPSCSRGDILDLSKADVLKHWDSSVWGLNEILRILREDCGVVGKNWIPYEPVLLPLAAAWIKHVKLGKKMTPAEQGKLRSRIKCLFWCACLSGEYEQGAVAKAARDFKHLVQWHEEGSEPPVVSKFEAKELTERLGDILPKNGAVYKALMCLSNSQKSTDFLKLDPLSSLVRAPKVDDHHVFPKAFLEKHVGETDSNRINSILNRTLIDAESNKSLGKTKPSKYFADIKKLHGEAKLNELLLGHLLPAGNDSPLFSDDFDEFLRLRRRLFEVEIAKATSLQ